MMNDAESNPRMSPAAWQAASKAATGTGSRTPSPPGKLSVSNSRNWIKWIPKGVTCYDKYFAIGPQ